MRGSTLRLLEAWAETFLDLLHAVFVRGIPLVDILTVVTVVGMFVVLAHRFIGFGLVVFALLLLLSVVVGSYVAVVWNQRGGLT